MINVFVIGTGNLGLQLCQLFEKEGGDQLSLIGYTNRTKTVKPAINAPLITNEVPECDLIIMAVPDDAIASTSKSIVTNAIVVHTSGSVPMDVLSDHSKHGVFYIPQTFNSYKPVRLDEITICLESSSVDVKEILWTVAGTLSRKRRHINSAQRQQLHLAAVYMNNFVNHCYHKAHEVLKTVGLHSDMIEGLMYETLENTRLITAYDAQTGPARRGDEQTIQRHLNQLPESDRALYRAITESIKKTYET